MRAVLSPVALLYVLASLLPVQVLASPKITSDATHPNSIETRDPLRRQGTQHTENPLLNLMLRVASGTARAQTDVDKRAAGRIEDAAATSPREQARSGREPIADRSQASTALMDREENLTAEEENGEPARTSLVLRSAAPKLFGINIYLIIAWLVFMYLMYRTGSI